MNFFAMSLVALASTPSLGCDQKALCDKQRKASLKLRTSSEFSTFILLLSNKCVQPVGSEGNFLFQILPSSSSTRITTTTTPRMPDGPYPHPLL